MKPGDVVMLKSGGPQMTIAAIEGDKVHCEWFEGTKALSKTFSAVSLDVVDLEASPAPVAISNSRRGW